MRDSDSGLEGRPAAVSDGDLYPLVENVRQYGDAHPGVLQQVWFEHSPTRVVALLGGDEPSTHERALRALAAEPDHLEIKRSAWPHGYLDQLRAEIWESFRGSLRGIGQGRGVIAVQLWAEQVEVAELLHQRYGAALELEVGYFSYPDIDSSVAAHFASSREPLDLPSLPELVTLSVEGGAEVRSGSHMISVLTIHNDTATELVAGKMVPPVVDPSNGRVVGGYEGAISLELRRDTVPAGTSKEVPIIIGTASTRPELGYALPPGHWALRILLELGEETFQRLTPIRVVP